MATFDELLKRHPRIIVLYPVYLGISDALEDMFPLVREVRTSPEIYSGKYISPRGMVGEITLEEDQIVELFTQWQERHVEVMTVLIRKEIQFWELVKKKYQGHTLVSLPGLSINFEVLELDHSLFQSK